MNPKLRHLFIPFLIIALSFICAYTFLHWLLIIETGIVSLKEDIVQIWLPIALPFIPVLIWINPRLRIISLKTRNGDLPSLYVFISAAAIGATTLITQDYISSASGKIATIANITEVEKTPNTKYFSVQRYYLDKTNATRQASAKTSGKYNQHLDLILCIAIPLYEKIEDTAAGACSHWLGMYYHKQISNRLSDEKKESLYDEFVLESEEKFDTANLNQFTYLERLGNTDIHDEYNKAIKKSELIKHTEPVVFVSRNGTFETRTGSRFSWIFISFGIGSLLWLIMILIPKLKKGELKKLQTGNLKPRNELKEILWLLIPKRGFYSTPIIINLNFAIFLIMVIFGLGFLSFRAIDLLQWGGNFRPSTMKGEWWRLLTSVFLHGGIMHIILNMASLLFAGIFLEPVLGAKRFAIFYLFAGIMASVASIWWHERTVSIGASGAIFGMYGISLALLLMKVFPKGFGRAFLVSTVIFVGYNLLVGMTGGIDNAAHIGGLISGFATGLIVAPRLKQEQVKALT